MCRLLCVRSKEPFAIETHVRKLAEIAQNSKEFQGHGWGCAYLRNGEWAHYKNIAPVWEDNLAQFGETTLLLAHARSAFRDEGITVENNMPFYDDKYIFIFNGELRGVRLNVEGRIGAEKIFNLVRRMDKGDMRMALQRAMAVLNKRTKYLRAANMIVASKNRMFVASQFNEDPDYFTMHYKIPTLSELSKNLTIICSEKYPGEQEWSPIANKAILEFE